MYKTEFVTAEEHAEYLKTKMPYTPHAVLDYLRVEVLNEKGMLVKGKLLYRHASGYSLAVSPWTYLHESDARFISPIRDFIAEQKPFYVTHGTRFLRVTGIAGDAQGNLVFYFEHHDVASLN